MASAFCLLTLGLCNLGSEQMQTAQQNTPAPRRGLFAGTANLLGLGGITNAVGGILNPQQLNYEVPDTIINRGGGAPHQSPCEQLFRYVSDGRQWKGVMELYDSNPNSEILVETQFSLPPGTPKNVSFALSSEWKSSNQSFLAAHWKNSAA